MARARALIVRPQSDDERGNILSFIESWLASGPPDEQRALYERWFLPQATAYEEGRAAHRRLVVAHEQHAAERVTLKAEADEALRRLFVELNLRHGAEGVRRARGLLNGKAPGAVARMPLKEGAYLMRELTRRAAAGDPDASELDAGLLTALGDVAERLWLSILHEDAELSARKRANARLDDLRDTFDRDWTTFVGMIGPMLGARIGELVPDLGRGRRKKG